MEKFILDLISKSSNIIFDNFAIAFDLLGTGGIIFIIIGIILIINKNTRTIGTHIILSLIFCLIFGNLILKPVIARRRPYVKFNRDILIPPLKDYSFPSGHTYASFATAFSIKRYDERMGKFMMVVAAMFAFSRMYLYVHYPTDIIGGIILGYCCSKLAEIIIMRFKRHKI